VGRSVSGEVKSLLELKLVIGWFLCCEQLSEVKSLLELKLVIGWFLCCEQLSSVFLFDSNNNA
jgi:hypothetical protein